MTVRHEIDIEHIGQEVFVICTCGLREKASQVKTSDVELARRMLNQEVRIIQAEHCINVLSKIVQQLSESPIEIEETGWTIGWF